MIQMTSIMKIVGPDTAPQ